MPSARDFLHERFGERGPPCNRSRVTPSCIPNELAVLERRGRSIRKALVRLSAAGQPTQEFCEVFEPLLSGRAPGTARSSLTAGEGWCIFVSVNQFFLAPQSVISTVRRFLFPARPRRLGRLLDSASRLRAFSDDFLVTDTVGRIAGRTLVFFRWWCDDVGLPEQYNLLRVNEAKVHRCTSSCC
jgi:hypothetical protein